MFSVNFDESISYKQYVQNQNQERQIPFHKIEHTEPPLVTKNEQPDLESSSDSSEHSEYKLVSKLKSEVKNESGESTPFKILPQEIDKKEPSFLTSDSSSPPPAAQDADSDKLPSLPLKTRKSTRVTKRPNYFQSNNVLSSASHYIEILDGHKEQPGKILKLNKALYGLKQSPRQWNETLHEFLISQNFQVSNANQCLYNKTVNGTLITVVIYVDDIIISSSDLEEIEKVKVRLITEIQNKRSWSHNEISRL